MDQNTFLDDINREAIKGRADAHYQESLLVKISSLKVDLLKPI